MIWSTILGALVPVVGQSVAQLVTRWVGGVRPTTVDEQIKLEQAEIQKLEALAKLDNPVGTPSQWVIDLRASARYIGALAVIAVGIGTLYIDVTPQVQLIALEAANISFGFLFGSRIVANLQKK